MSGASLHKDEFHVIGIAVRTSNTEEMSGAGRIGALWERFSREGVLEAIPARVVPGQVLSVYTNYESDEHGKYDVVLGAAVASDAVAPPGMVRVRFPAADYAVVLSGRGAMPGIVVDAWKSVWAAKGTAAPAGRRRFTADFEVYDARAADPSNAQVELLVSVL